MNIFAALFRGINVGGSNILPMKELAALLQDLGCGNVRTYIQSGNAVFRHKEPRASRLVASIREAIGASHGFEPEVLLLSVDKLERAVSSNPFPDAESEPSRLHLSFLAATPESPDLDLIEALRADTEGFALKDDVAYLHAPDGIGRSKLAARMERALGVVATGRNWRTVSKILEMARGV
jgi:uncharacterized protein (DUF1697 family)